MPLRCGENEADQFADAAEIIGAAGVERERGSVHIGIGKGDEQLAAGGREFAAEEEFIEIIDDGFGAA